MPNGKKLRTGPHRVSDLFDLKKYPALVIVWGIFVGDGCITGSYPLDWKTIEAHAHALDDDEWQGWICVADPRAVVTSTGRPSHTILHEVGHLELKNASHGKKWYDAVVHLGATAEAKKYYSSRKKKESQHVIHEELHDGTNS